MKKSTIWICRSCGHISYQWIGKCPPCSEWNTMEDKRLSIAEIETLSIIPLCANNKVSEKAVWEGISSGSDSHVSGISNMPTHSSTMVCYKCNGVIPTISEYCPRCGIKLYTTCTKCNNKYSSEYSYCFMCGNGRDNNTTEIKGLDSHIKDKIEWRCDVCGNVFHGSIAPIECTLCHVKGHFISKDVPKYKCLVCGWMHYGYTPPLECPLCYVNQENFTLVNE